jgi:hypothetical protein
LRQEAAIAIKIFIKGKSLFSPYFEKGIGISGSKVESNNFRTARPILVIRSSNDAPPQKKFGSYGRTAKV